MEQSHYGVLSKLRRILLLNWVGNARLTLEVMLLDYPGLRR